jgi:uncharacterized membrane protein
MLVGFGSGTLFELGDKAKSIFFKIGLAAIGLFVLLRVINVYGDSFPWSYQKTGLYTFLSFINVTKYPPSLQFCLLFLGLMFLILSVIQGVQNRWTDIACVYKVPLFFFVVHWYIIHSLVFDGVFAGFKPSDMIFGSIFAGPGQQGLD